MDHANPPAMFLTVEDVYGIREIIATVVWRGPDGLESPTFTPVDRRTEYANLRIAAYLDRNHHDAWGASVGYRPHTVDLRRAQSMARVLHRIATRMTAASKQHGHPDTYHAFLTQVASALRISRYLVRADDDNPTNTGDGYRHHDATGIRHWISLQEQRYGKPRP
jgi:hypothetical protein